MLPPLPGGFRLAGVHCGVKTDAGKQDLTLLACDGAAVAGGVYTQNRVVAASVVRNRRLTPGDDIRAVVINSGNANACTGEQGMADTQDMARCVARVCSAQPEQVLVMSTGIIGVPLPMDKITAGIEAAAGGLGGDESSLIAAVEGMMTTDTTRKIAGRSFSLGARAIQITGIAKGAGMIGPNMATMLAVLMTDAVLAPDDAQQVLAAAVDRTFNCISVDGHMSTSDTVLLLASGAAGGEALAGADLAAFGVQLAEAAEELAKAIPTDGEGASHLIQIDVEGCATRADAHRIAKTIAESPLVKTAAAGGDPNWGRIVSAAGYAGVAFDPARVDLYLNGTLLYKQGAPVEFDAAAVSGSIRQNPRMDVVLRLGEGQQRVRFWSSDLTVDYVRFNADYHT